MKTLRIKFVDQWKGHVPEQDPYFKILAKHFSVELSDDPDYVFDGGLGREHLRYERAVKLVTVGENVVPDFNCFDYAIGFDRLSFGDRYLRIPLYAFYAEYRDLAHREPPAPDVLLKRDFCSFVVSNGGGADPLRARFFRELGKYRPVASGGHYLNNVGGPVADKAAFCRGYKFNIAFENSVSPGYVTEKVMQPMSWFSLPIYYGDPFVEEEFNPASMVRVRSADDVERAIEEIIRLDRNDEEYLARVTAPCLTRTYGFYDGQLEKFLVDIVSRPFEACHRLNRYGYQPILRQRLRRQDRIEDVLRVPLRILRKLRP